MLQTLRVQLLQHSLQEKHSRLLQTLGLTTPHPSSTSTLKPHTKSHLSLLSPHPTGKADAEHDTQLMQSCLARHEAMLASLLHQLSHLMMVLTLQGKGGAVAWLLSNTHCLYSKQIGISASQDQEQTWREQRRWWQGRAGLRPAPLLWSHLLPVRAGRQARAGLISKTGRAGLCPAPLPSAHQVGPTSGLAASHYSVSQLTFAICDPTVSCSAPVHVCVYYPHHPMFAWSA